MESRVWSTQQLGEFIAAVSDADTEAAAARAAVERAAEALDADVAAIVCDGELVAAVGYPAGRAPVLELARIRPGVLDASLDVPGAGRCGAAAAALEHPPGATLVIARGEPDGLEREETALVHGMARVTAMTMRLLRVIDDERAARRELGRLAGEQAALRRVATLVAGAAPAGDVFAAVAEEAGRVIAAADFTMVGRYDPDGAVEVVGGWSREGQHVLVGRRGPLGGRNVSTLVFERNEPVRVDRLGDDAGVLTAAALETGIRSSVGAPINVEGRLWGVMMAASAHEHALPGGTEAHLGAFTELVATAIANAEAQTELRRSRARIVASADQARRRLERDLHDGAQQRLVSLSFRVRAARAAVPAELGELAAELDAVDAELSATLEELREIARGLHPAVLAEGGLGPALRALARRSSLPVALELHADGRLPEPVEVGAYYVVSEALTNAAKHAHAAAATVAVEAAGGLLRVSVRDDGVGGADIERGTGLLGLRDRVEALGGRLALDSPPGAGTLLRAELPLGAAANTA